MSDHEVCPDDGSVLCKAQYDPFEYALGLVTGETIYFESAKAVGNGEWLHLSGLRNQDTSDMDDRERGVDVRISAIVWIRDTGH